MEGYYTDEVSVAEMKYESDWLCTLSASHSGRIISRFCQRSLWKGVTPQTHLLDRLVWQKVAVGIMWPSVFPCKCPLLAPAHCVSVAKKAPRSPCFRLWQKNRPLIQGHRRPAWGTLESWRPQWTFRGFSARTLDHTVHCKRFMSLWLLAASSGA